VLPLLSFPDVLKPNTVNLNNKIMSLYLEKLLCLFCAEGDDAQYGSSATADIAVLQALSKRIHFGKYIAEAKFLADEEVYTKLIQQKDIEGIRSKLVNVAVEQKLLQRVQKKAATYGQEIDQPDAEKRFKVPPELFVKLYKEYIIPLTIEVEILYLLQRLQGPSVSFLGPFGTFSQEASIKYFHQQNFTSYLNNPDAVLFLPSSQIEEVFANVMSNKTLYGIIPLENSQTGLIHNHVDLLINNSSNNNIKVVGEVYLPIQFALMVNNNSAHYSLSSVKKIYSHVQGLEQCKSWIRTHCVESSLLPVSSTAKAAEIVSSEEGSACISNRICSELFKLRILAEKIQDTQDNMTRFIIIAKEPLLGRPSGKDKTLMTFGVLHTPGALSGALSSFSSNGVNLTSLQSFPDRINKFNYCFFVEFEGHQEDTSVQKALTDLQTHSSFINTMGSFPSGSSSTSTSKSI